MATQKPPTRPKRRNRAKERNARLRRLNQPWMGPPVAPKLTAGSELDRVILYGLDEIDVSRRVVDGTLTTACDQGTGLTIDVLDRDGDLSQDGLLDSQRDLRLDPMDVRAAGTWWRLQTIERTEDGWTLTLEDRVVAWLREERGKLAVSRAKSTRAQFFARLFKAARVDAYIPQIDDRQRIEERKADADAGGTEDDSKSTAANAQKSTAGVGALSGATVKGAKATPAQRRIIDGILTEARKLGASRRVMIACIMCATQESRMGADAQRTGNDDTGIFQQGRNWIPLNKVMNPAATVKAFLLGGQAFGKSAPGWKQKHGSIKKATGNLSSLITSVQVSIGGYGAWEKESTKTVDRWLKANGGEDTSSRDSGEKTTSRTVTKSYTFERTSKENTWTACRRMADDVEWLLFATQGMVVYASLDELARARPVVTIDRDDPEVVDSPKWKQDARGIAQELTCSVASSRAWGLTAGMCVMVQGEGPADGRWVVFSTSRLLSEPKTELTLRRTVPRKLEPAAETRTITKTVRASGAAPGKTVTGSAGRIRRNVGAKGIVEDCVRIAIAAGGDVVYAGSTFRPNSTTTSGSRSDHASNDSHQAARDIGRKGVDLLVGPPSPRLDRGVVAIGKGFGRNYGDGKRKIVDTFQWNGYRIQIIWRTPEYGGHMGHIHVGVRKN